MSEHDEHEDAALSALYRRVARQQPSPQLDARVLATARQRNPRQSRRWWLPLSTAAVMVLAVSLLWRQQHNSPELLPQRLAQMESAPVASAPARAPAAEAKVAESAPPRKAEEQPAAKPVPRSAPTTPPLEVASAEAELSAEASTAETPQDAQIMSFSDSFLAEISQEKQAAAAPEGGAAPPAPSEAEKRRVAKSAAQPEAPEAWLKRIEALRSKGDVAAARRELLAFRQAYPDQTLPKELQALLPEATK